LLKFIDMCFEEKSAYVHKLVGVDLTTVLYREVTLGQLQWAHKHLYWVVTSTKFLKVPRQLLPDAQPQSHRIVSSEQKMGGGDYS